MVSSSRLHLCVQQHANIPGPRSLCGLDFYLLSSSMQGFVFQNSLEKRCADQASTLKNGWCLGPEDVGCDWGNLGRCVRCGMESGTAWPIPRAVRAK